MKRLFLDRPALQIACEVHVAEFDKTGLQTGAQYMIKLLTEKGDTVQWLGSADIHA